MKSRSELKREAVMRGEPMPTFDETTRLMGGPISADVELIRFVGGPRDGETRYVLRGTRQIPWVGPAAWYLTSFGQQAERHYWRSDSRRNDGEPTPFMWDGA